MSFLDQTVAVVAVVRTAGRRSLGLLAVHTLLGHNLLVKKKKSRTC